MNFADKQYIDTLEYENKKLKAKVERKNKALDKEEFEETFKDKLIIDKYSYGEYMNDRTKATWRGWQAARRWISVSERLPEKPYNCLVVCNGYIEFGYYFEEQWWVNEWPEGIVTYWKTLPPPPEER